MLPSLLRSVIPGPIRRRIRSAHRAYCLVSGLREVSRCIGSSAGISTAVAERLIYGWNNEGWSTKPTLTTYLVNELRSARGTILECGSGLSTVLLGMIGRHTGARVVSLEHNAEWHRMMRGRLAGSGFGGDGVHLAPLVPYGGFHWYDFESALADVQQLDLVLCDGPPSGTPGGRYGLMPCLTSCLSDGARIIVDDTMRSAESAMINRWISESGDRLTVEKTFAEFTVLQYRSSPR